MPSGGLGDKTHHLLNEPLGALFAGGLNAMDAHEEGVNDIFHVLGQISNIVRPDPDLLFELLRWHLANSTEGSPHALVLH